MNLSILKTALVNVIGPMKKKKISRLLVIETFLYKSFEINLFPRSPKYTKKTWPIRTLLHKNMHMDFRKSH